MKEIIKTKLNNLLEKEKKFDPLNEPIHYGFCFKCFVEQDDDFKILMELIKNNIAYFDKDFIQI